jgi:hypothetical protein
MRSRISYIDVVRFCQDPDDNRLADVKRRNAADRPLGPARVDRHGAHWVLNAQALIRHLRDEVVLIGEVGICAVLDVGLREAVANGDPLRMSGQRTVNETTEKLFWIEILRFLRSLSGYGGRRGRL